MEKKANLNKKLFNKNNLKGLVLAGIVFANTLTMGCNVENPYIKEILEEEKNQNQQIQEQTEMQLVR